MKRFCNPDGATMGLLAVVAQFVVVTVFSVATATSCLAVAVAAEAGGAKQHAAYVGSAKCRSCHEAEYSAWKGSDHDLAMQEAGAATVLGDFADATYEADGVTSKFRTRDGKYFVRTDGPDGTPAEYEVKFTFGVRPLQQYLVEFPGGRLQPLRQSWDSRPKEAGGQRWFHLYPGEKLGHDDQLHWTGIYQNWNLQCASCHSTDLRKNYDAATNAYATSYAEIDVACESCHGAGREHVAWADKSSPPYAVSDRKGLAAVLRGHATDAWRFATTDARFATLDPAADRVAASVAMNTCAPCHARRSTISGNIVPGAVLEDSHRLALLTEPLYFADGQQHDEVYTWGSFLQSKMHAKGVTCSDCHDPHSLRTKAEGNALCAQCHNAAVFDTKVHHFHEPGTRGAQCVECHMPSRDYMAIDGRRDHSLRVPRPDLSAALASPDACSTCHAGRTPQWSVDAMDRWYGPDWRKRPEYGSTLRSAATKGSLAVPLLLALASDAAQPGIVRATSAALAAPLLRPQTLAEVRGLLADPDPLVRVAALGLVESLEAGPRISAAALLLSDPQLLVRIEAARVLANAPDASLTPAQREARTNARREYLDLLNLESDWPATLATRGNFELREGRTDDAVASYQRAIRLDPRFAGAYVNLADAWRLQGKDKDGEALLRRGLAVSPDAAGIHHALGLLLVRKGDRAAGLEELGQAAGLEPANGRYAYVYAVGLQSAGKVEEALTVLAAADQRRPYDFDILGALISMNLEAGRSEAALMPARKLAEVLPEDPGLKDLIAKLEKGPPK